MFRQWQQGALSQLKHTIDTLTQKNTQRAKVTAPPTESDEENEEETQVRQRTPVHLPERYSE